MSTCAKRALIQVGDRPGRVRKAALAVQSAVQQMQPRVLPQLGGFGRPMGMPSNYGRPLNLAPLGSMGGGAYNPMELLARSVGTLGREVADAFAPPRGPVGHSGGRQPNAARGTGGTGIGDGTGTGPATGGGVGPGTFARGELVIGEFEAPYTEPMLIPLPPNFTPAAVIAGRIIAPSDITRYFRSGVGCDAVPYGARMLLRSIDGMTIGDPTVLRYTFIYYGIANA